ncbi:MAG: PilZ domain-containing protein [Thermodesulfobacteriota bacterium]
MARTKDRRRESRLPYRATIDANFGKVSFTGKETRDISITGTFIEDISGPKKGDTCKLVLQLKGEASDLYLKLKAEVVRNEEKGLALEFLDVTRDCFYHLKNIAYVIQANPDEIICTNYKKPRKSKVVVLDEFDHRFDAGEEDEDD